MPKELPHPDRILASAIQYLIGGGEEDAASVLLSCSMELEVWDNGTMWGSDYTRMRVSLCGPRAAVDVLDDVSHPQYKEIDRSLEAVLRPYGYFPVIVSGAEMIEIDAGRRKELLEIARGRSVSNQAPSPEALRLWRNLRFRSESEIRVAKALDKAGVAF